MTKSLTEGERSVHLLKKSGANRKHAYADREEFTDRSASYKREKHSNQHHSSTQTVHQQEVSKNIHMAGGSDGVSDSSTAAYPVLLLHVQLLTDARQGMDGFSQHCEMHASR